MRGREKGKGKSVGVPPGFFSSGDVSLAVEGDVGEGVAVDELDGPVEDADEAAEHAERDRRDDVAGLGFLLLRDADRLPQHVDERDDQRAEADAAERVRNRAPERTALHNNQHAPGLPAAEIPAVHGSQFGSGMGHDGSLGLTSRRRRRRSSRSCS